MSTPAAQLLFRPATIDEIVDLRWRILRAGLPRETAVFEGDDWPETQHFGAFAGGRLQGIATILRAPFSGEPQMEARQLRGMAVLPETQGTGCGTALVGACIAAARDAGAAVLWCNARTPAAKFYARLGFETVGGEFEIPTAGPHYRMFLPLT
jgi:GNAT superfamily N-acetyltransferase